VTATDAAGNVGTATGTLSVDTTAPNAPAIDPINAVDPITGTAEPGSTVTVTFPDGSTAQVVADPTTGAWTVANPGNLLMEIRLQRQRLTQQEMNHYQQQALCPQTSLHRW
jgi:hypothetical protein